MPTDLVLVLAPDRTLRITRDSAGWGAREERIPWTTDTIVVRGVVRSNLYDAIDSGAVSLLTRQARAELAWVLADIYEYRVDMSRDLQAGDAVRVVFERSRLPNGTARIGMVIAAGLERGGRELEAVRFVPSDGTRAEFFDREGRSLRAAFLRAPLQFRRISSGFGRRLHPILGVWRAHRGTDYAASSGTPVRSIGEGTVVSAGLSGGYGQAIDVRHPNGFVSRYGHLRGFASGIRRGARVAMGETIGYVGATGMATAPHLHFEILVGGVQRDPRRALTERAGAPLASGDRPAFARALAAADAAFAGRTGGKATADSAP